ncbi:MAG: hypothetical protein AB1758_21655, partial [Candidatus Eremiobacterota bacterium]
NRLEAYRGWDGWHRTVVARDPQSGVETVFDPKEQTIEVTTPTVTQEVASGQSWYRNTYHRDARQTVDAQGNCSYVSNLNGEQEFVMVGYVREMGATHPFVVQDDRSYEETRIEKGQAPVTHKVEATKHEKKTGAQLASSVTPDGKLTIAGEDGVTRSYEMFLRV